MTSKMKDITRTIVVLVVVAVISWFITRSSPLSSQPYQGTGGIREYYMRGNVACYLAPNVHGDPAISCLKL